MVQGTLTRHDHSNMKTRVQGWRRERQRLVVDSDWSYTHRSHAVFDETSTPSMRCKTDALL